MGQRFLADYNLLYGQASLPAAALVGDEFKITNTPTLTSHRPVSRCRGQRTGCCRLGATGPRHRTAQTYLSVSQENNLTIDTITGEVRLTESPDYETRTSYDFTVTASDGVLSDSIDVTLNVGDVNEAHFSILGKPTSRSRRTPTRVH